MAITKKQKWAMTMIVIAGLAAAGGLLWAEKLKAQKTQTTEASGATPGATSPSAQAEDEKHEHSEDEKPAGKTASTEPGKAAGKEPTKEDHDERLVKLNEAQIGQAGIQLQAAGPGKLQGTTQFPGEIKFNEDRTAHVVPRLAGVAERVTANLGQTVRKDEVLAIIASTALSEQRSELLSAQRRRESARETYAREKKLWEDKISAEQDYQQARTALQEADIAVQNARQKLAAIGAVGASSSVGASSALNRFEVRAPFDGIIVAKHLTMGEAVKEDASIFTLSDLRSVWAEFDVAPKDLATVRIGQRVIVSSTAFESKVEGTVSYVGALLGEQTRTARARVTLVNPQGAWRPGLFVTVSVLGEAQEAPLTVPVDAIQTVEDKPMVFKAVPGGFEATPIQPGRSDGRTVEVLGGLQAGDRIVGKNAFVLKSELGKASANHGH